MYITTSLLTALILCPLAVLSQATPTSIDTSQQTIVPFTTLPSCATLCGPLYDAQGACSPPVVPATSLSCFCGYGTLQPFYTSATGVCPNACPSDPNGLAQIQQWFLGLCSKGTSQTTATGSSPTTPASATTSGASIGDSGNSGDASGNSGTSSSSQNQTWISTHWQWIIMVVVLSLAITLGWIGACLLRRRYKRRKEREYELRPPAAPWVTGPGAHPGGISGASPYGDVKGKNRESVGGMFISRPMSTARMSEKKEAKKWVVTERT